MLPLFSVLKCPLLFSSAAIIPVFNFFMEVNNVNPGQTAPWEQSDLGSYCLH